MVWWVRKSGKQLRGPADSQRGRGAHRVLHPFSRRPFVTRESEPKKVGEAFLDYVHTCVPASEAGLLVMPAVGVAAMRVIASRGSYAPAAESMLPPETGVLAGALKLGRPVLRRDGRPPKAVFEAELGSDAAAAPIVDDNGKTVGAAAIYGPEGSIGQTEQEQLLECRDAAFGPLIASFRLARAQAEITVQRSIVDLAARLVGGLDVDQLVASVLGCALELTGSETGSVMLLDEAGRLRIARAKGLPDEIVQSTVLSLGEGISGWVARTGKGMVIEDAEPAIIGRHAMRETRSAVSVPMVTPEGELFGVVNVGASSTTARHSDLAVRLLGELGELAAMALRTARRSEAGKEGAHPVSLAEVRPNLRRPSDAPGPAKVDAVLFDLDGTLLDVDIELFWRRYFDRLGQFFKDLADPASFVASVREATGVMLRNIDPDRTNKEVFWDYFQARLGIPSETLAPRVEAFYEEEFPKLKDYTERVPLARDVVETALGLGVPVVIATNPVFPRKAIEHRLQWAGIADLAYAMVTSYEFMHACKPRREYYEEIAHLLGVSTERCLMVGNDEENDIPAEELGMRCFLVVDRTLGRTSRLRARDSGSMADLLEYLKGLA